VEASWTVTLPARGTRSCGSVERDVLPDEGMGRAPLEERSRAGDPTGSHRVLGREPDGLTDDAPPAYGVPRVHTPAYIRGPCSSVRPTAPISRRPPPFRLVSGRHGRREPLRPYRRDQPGLARWRLETTATDRAPLEAL